VTEASQYKGTETWPDIPESDEQEQGIRCPALEPQVMESSEIDEEGDEEGDDEDQDLMGPLLAMLEDDYVAEDAEDFLKRYGQ
jgi:hypothetical protein